MLGKRTPESRAFEQIFPLWKTQKSPQSLDIFWDWRFDTHNWFLDLPDIMMT